MIGTTTSYPPPDKLFVNWNNCIWSQTGISFSNTSFSAVWTATEDCYFRYSDRKSSSSYSTTIKINDGPGMVQSIGWSVVTGNACGYYLKQGDIFYTKVDGGTYVRDCYAYSLL